MDDTEKAILDAEGMKKHLDDSVVLLRSVRSSLADLLREVVEGNGGALKDLAAKQGELESALKRVFEAEHRYNEWIKREGGRTAPGDIDFDAIRHQIGCRLHRLRDCG